MPLSYQLAKLLLLEKTTLPDVVTILTKYKMLALLPSIHKALSNLSKNKGIYTTIMIETPYTLSLDSVDIIKAMVGNKNAPHTITLNKDVLAGFRARFEGTLYDGSAERIIKQFISSH
jgi:F0F1-type ATP synthase delta subunit